MKIRQAEKQDAKLIGEAITSAIGENISNSLAGKKGINNVKAMFARLATEDNSQYSYRNTLKAVNDNGEIMGFAVGYDGALLHQLRKRFLEEAKVCLGKDMEETIGNECKPDEFYLDSLAVFPEHRGQGVARALVKAMGERATDINKPLGLLCEKDNINARKLYDSLGFKQVGETLFAGEMMNHMQAEIK